MAIIIERVTGPMGKKQVMLLEALQQVLDKAPPPPEGFDVQTFRLLSVEWVHGGFVKSTTTRVVVEVNPGFLPTDG